MAGKDIQEGLKQLIVLLAQEKEEDLLQYKRKMIGTSLAERRKQGVCWYPVQLEKTKFDSGDRVLVKVSRPQEHTESHMFQSGKLVSLFSTAGSNEEDQHAVNGVVNYVSKQDMLMTLNADDIPDWINDGQLGVQLLFDENAYREMEKAVKKLIKTSDERLNELKEILLAGREAQFRSHKPVTSPGLNESQNKALNLVLSATDVAIIHGPPGTGKTTTLIQAILETLKIEKQTLVCAPSNAAVDLLADRLGEQGVNVLRIGHPARVTEETLGKTLDVRITKHPDYKNLKALRKQAEEYRSMGKKYKRHFGYAEREQRKRLLTEARALYDEADHLSFYITSDIIAKSQVIACTMVGANSAMLKGMHFNTVFMDEAAQALEPASWIPIIKADRVIFAGDHCQLPPTIKSFEAARNGLEITLFEKAIKQNQADVMLEEQYRMNMDIMNFSSRIFYKNRLVANQTVAHWKIFEGDQTVEFIDTAGCGFFEDVDPETMSSFNTEEAELLLRHFRQYIEEIKALEKFEEVESIGIIAPYKAQVSLLQDLVQQSNFDEQLVNKLTVNTVDSFQGQERDIIYITLVRSNEKGEIGFLANTRRMNVAITRARKKLVIIGDSATIGQNEFYSAFLDYVNEIGAYRSAFELMY
ncbi:putative helicase [Fulvivirga imtechensis AK7]|uniref:DNA helicase n=1 Tax=Fulvivirga imtechensis AK7 TaxID=1237149 RepID=L8JHN3_9BACT|nr:AAA domain-containing protein [Fulvivirga imtechensis]ELR68315.1 putative helicase [Fulvivirga imtechensis AK7]